MKFSASNFGGGRAHMNQQTTRKISTEIFVSEFDSIVKKRIRMLKERNFEGSL